MPSRPYIYSPTATIGEFELSSLGSKVAESEQKRQAGYEDSRRLMIALIKARKAVEDSNDEASVVANQELDDMLNAMAAPQANRTPREATLSMRVEDYVRFKAYTHFLDTGHLLAPSSCAYATDEEYLGGACMGLSQDLARYGMGRATARDSESVQMARNLVEQVLQELLKFDFRNGPLRRKYDGTKYALRTLETLLYELSVTGGENGAEQPDAKRPKTEKDALLPQKEELTELRARMDHRDSLREKLIKKCRDGQKAAKQAIFALHRGDRNRAMELLKQCQTCITEELVPIVDEEPPLRHGSFANVLEEFAEAKLFYTWLHGKDLDAPTEHPSGILLNPDECDVTLTAEEYLGGLCDLTGEVGRYAVQRGTARDTDGVKLCLQTNTCIQKAIQTMERIPSSIGKKMDTLRRSIEKLERILYEMSLSEAAGGRNVSSNAEPMDDTPIGE